MWFKGELFDELLFWIFLNSLIYTSLQETDLPGRIEIFLEQANTRKHDSEYKYNKLIEGNS